MLSYKKHNRWAKQGGKVPNTNRTMLAPCLVHALPWAPFGSYPQDSPIWFTSSHVRGAMHLSHRRSKSNAYDWFIKCLWLVTWQDKVACHGNSLRLLWLRAPDNLASEDQTSGLRPGTAEFMHDLISRSVRRVHQVRLSFLDFVGGKLIAAWCSQAICNFVVIISGFR
jgi:hypothetical protein